MNELAGWNQEIQGSVQLQVRCVPTRWLQPPGFAEIKRLGVLKFQIVVAVIRPRRLHPQPLEFDTLPRELALEVREVHRRVAHLARGQTMLDTEGGECAGRFADVPLRRMDSERAVGDMGHAEILAGRDRKSV